MVKEYFRPTSVDEALRLLAVPDSLAVAGGTFALAFEAKEKPGRIVDLGKALPRGIERRDGRLVIGAGTTFQELIESEQVPELLKAAALTMVNRNTRNRATIGGNLGANKTCSSLTPSLLVLGATVEYKDAAAAGTSSAMLPLADWLASPRGLILSVAMALPHGLRAACQRASRSACDIATSTAACAYRLDGGVLRELKVAAGGFGPRASLRPDIAALFEGKALPSKADIEKAVAPFLATLSDQRGSAEYKRLRGAVLVADTLHAAKDLL